MQLACPNGHGEVNISFGGEYEFEAPPDDVTIPCPECGSRMFSTSPPQLKIVGPVVKLPAEARDPQERVELFGRRSRGAGTGRVTHEEDLERAQTHMLGEQMIRATAAQLEFASERIKSIRWIETEGSRHVDHIVITEFELILNNGKRLLLRGPVIEMQLEGMEMRHDH
jgi:hypothetical protein